MLLENSLKFKIILMTLFLWFLFLPALEAAWAKECPQDRQTQKAPPSFLSKRNPLRQEHGISKKEKYFPILKPSRLLVSSAME